eukprot:g8568.t1
MQSDINLNQKKAPRRRLVTIHNKTNLTKNKINRLKNNDILLYELAENFHYIFNYLGIYEVMPKAGTSKIFFASINAWLANKRDLNLVKENLAHISYDRIVKILCKMPWLQNLHLNKSVNITDDTLRNAVACCPQITEIDVSQCSQLTPESIKYISNCRSLNNLNINLAFLKFDRFELIQQLARNNVSILRLSMSTCKIINVGYDWYLVCEEVETSDKRNTNHCLAALSLAHPKLEQLNLSGNMTLNYKGIRTLSMSNSFHSTLTTLDLSFCLLSCDCAEAVCESLCLLQGLTHLNLRAAFDINEYTSRNPRKGPKFFLENESIQAIA